MAIWSSLKTAAATVIVSTLRIVSSAGSSLFGVLNLFKYLGKEDHPQAIPISYVAIGVNATTTLTTTVPAIYRQFRNKKKLNPSDNDNNEDENTAIKTKEEEQHLPCCAKCCCIATCLCDDELGFKGRSIYFTIKVLGILSGTFASLNFYLGAVTMSEFARKRIYGVEEPLEKWESWEIGAALSFAALCALSNYIAFCSYRLKKISANGKKFATIVDHGGSLCDKEAVKTFTISSLNIISAPFFGYFSTSKALLKIPFVPIPDTAAKMLAAASAGTLLNSTLFSDVPALYDSFKHPKTQTTFAENPRWESFARIGIYCNGGFDSLLSVGCSTFVSIVNTSHDVFKVDPYSYTIMIPAVLCAASKTANSFSFSVRQSYIDTLKDYHERKGHIAYQAIDSHEKKDIEAGTSIYGQPSPLLFSPKQEEEESTHHDAKVSVIHTH
ncbi:hypothetical protein [Aquicella lusitana]|uniref:Uncharacterized protein n=1 Tax=Aquicella lusitana TaxID=254246 RepID=A0A370GIW5_9COXI|nr:hypothetical protein [Aquicella lusitana]RDI43742.1 hypothetical protein C8D86_11012 [Aquicella lusitana]VVC74527.1 hypothetical protein AQULUS_22930 [Aquicella lusitana]